MLPQEFLERMENMLGEEDPAFLKGYDIVRYQALRLNPQKGDDASFLNRMVFSLERVPWAEHGYYYTAQDTPGKHPYHEAGVYYIQEPSAMAPAAYLTRQMADGAGERILDLCAAPGGKATELGAKLNGEGLLLANDISNSRAKALLKNLELMGIPNIYVTSETSEKLAKILPEFFDKILVDAPCSGEGMFRKEPRMMADWEQQGPEYYSKLQREIILDAADMLRPGGKLLYSTCTFSELENEGTIQYLLEQRPDMKLIPCAPYEGFAKGRRGLEACVRIFPHRMNGEGHFLALLEKQGEPRNRKKATGKNSVIPTEAKEFLENWGMYKREWQYYLRDERLYALGKKDGMPENLRYLRTGLYLGECKKKRFEPSQALAMVLDGEGENRIHLNRDDPRVIRYLKGETLDVSDLDLKKRKGWQLVCVDEYPLGWGKLAGGSLKNKYYAGWRWQ